MIKILQNNSIITAHRREICSVINHSSKRSPKTLTFFSAFVAVEENPEMRRIIEYKKCWGEAMTDDMELNCRTDCEDASNPIYEHWLRKKKSL
jgi:hypothetical protein